MKKSIGLLLCVIMLACSMLSACGQPAAPATSGKNVSSGASAATKSEPFEIVMIAKTEGLQWFDCMREGLERFDKEHDDVVASMSAPEGADSAKQVAMVDDFIAKGVDAIIIIAIDPKSLVSVVKKAKDAGIVVVINEGESLAGIADLDIEGAAFADRGRAMAEAFAKAMGGKGKYVGAVGALTMVTHVEMYKAGVAYLKEKYPNMQCLTEEPFEASIDAQKGYEKFKEIVNAYPDLNGYFPCVTEGNLGACRYLQETNNKNIVVGGGGTPSAMKDYILNGWAAFACSSNPIEQGYACVSATYKILKGEKITDGINLGNPYFEKCTYDSKINKLIGNGTVIYTKDNVKDFKY